MSDIDLFHLEQKKEAEEAEKSFKSKVKYDTWNKEVVLEYPWRGGIIRDSNYAMIMGIFNALQESGKRFKYLGLTENRDEEGRVFYELAWE